jgi:hypothetical protein
MKQSALARAIERDLLREPPAVKVPTAECFLCGRAYLYVDFLGTENSRFCSGRCRELYDSGAPAHDPSYGHKDRRQWYSLPLSMEGFRVKCASCRKQFDSKGLRCCSAECERSYRERNETLVILNQIGSEPAGKRKCAECGADIPNWRDGRRVSKATRFCSDRCSARSRRKMASARLAA